MITLKQSYGLLLMFVALASVVFVYVSYLPFTEKDYSLMIEELQNRGYKFYTLDKSYDNGKVVYLVHCADNSFSGAGVFYKSEAHLRVKSTFMIRPDSKFFTQNIDVFLQLQNYGWKLGYEYDCLSRANNNMTLAITIFQAQVNYLKNLGLNIVATDAHGDTEYNINIDSNQIYYQHSELWKLNNLVSIFNLPNFDNYTYLSDSNHNKIVLPDNLNNKLIIECHTDWYI